MIKYSKYFVELHYSVKQNDLRIFRTDTFFFKPTYELESDWEIAEQKQVMKHISRFIRKPSTDGSIYIKKSVLDGFDEHGMQKFKHPNIAFFNIRDGAAVLKHWMEEHNRYTSSDSYGPERAISKLMELVEVY